jgi:hypothetical protein
MATSQTPPTTHHVASFLVTINQNEIVVSQFVRPSGQYPNSQIFLILSYHVVGGTTAVYEFEIKGLNRLINDTHFEIDRTRRIMGILHLTINTANVIRFLFADDRNNQVTIFRRYDFPLSGAGYPTDLQQGLNDLLAMDFITADALPDWYAP